jgi:hypothetical protein
VRAGELGDSGNGDSQHCVSDRIALNVFEDVGMCGAGDFAWHDRRVNSRYVRSERYPLIDEHRFSLLNDWTQSDTDLTVAITVRA